MDRYDHTDIEKKWQERWAEAGVYNTEEDSSKPKTYVLDMFPYPSGEGLHVGHPRGYVATDVYSRMKRMQGYNVLHPMGWDAFGLPAENFAIKNKVHPREAVEKNIARFKQQLAHIGFDYDWNREINTTDSEYYKWTQWIFLKLYEKGLAHESYEPINWCPSCQTGLANEDIEHDGTCERCGALVEKKPMRQWVLKITDYADRLLADLDTLTEWPEHIKEAQRNWIGRSEGAEIDFKLILKKHPEPNTWRDPEGKPAQVTVFTTRPDTLYGATYLVLAPEHPWVRAVWDTPHDDAVANKDEVAAYVKSATAKSERERQEEKEKTGVLLEGITAVHPITKEELPVYVADYVLASYGTGAIMAVPAHDERDRAFAEIKNLPIIEVVSEEGYLINSGNFSGLTTEEAKRKITKEADGRMTTTYRIQDWVFSRQRYWGEPIPIIHCNECGVVPVPENQLPVTLPEVENYAPTGTGESPLAGIEDWVITPCPKCGGEGKRETNTMPQWAGSSWYWLRFMDPHNTEALVAEKKEKQWGPVDVYVGGDHAVRHLIYARFWHKFFYDINVVHTIEPFTRLEFLGFILAEDGRKMSKRWGNVINPDDVIKNVGADSFRMYEMFIGPFENAIAWSTNGLVGVRRFLERVWRLADGLQDSPVESIEVALNQTIQKVSSDIEHFKFNTAVSQMMIFVNEAEKKGIGKNQYTDFLKLLAPFAPHMAEELWERLGNEFSVHTTVWPEYDSEKITADTVEIGFQINGKTRGAISVPRDSSEEEVIAQLKANEKTARYIDFEPRKVIFVPNKIINFLG